MNTSRAISHLGSGDPNLFGVVHDSYRRVRLVEYSVFQLSALREQLIPPLFPFLVYRILLPAGREARAARLRAAEEREVVHIFGIVFQKGVRTSFPSACVRHVAILRDGWMDVQSRGSAPG